MSLPHVLTMVNFGPLVAQICWRVWAPLQISTGFAFCLRYCSDVAHRRLTKLCTTFGRLLGCYTVYTFSWAIAPQTELPGAKFTLRLGLAFFFPLPSNRHHRSSGYCLDGKGENYQVCSVQYCVQQLCTVRCTHI